LIRSSINPARFFGLLDEHFCLLGSILDREEGKSFSRISADSFRARLASYQPHASWEQVRDTLLSYGILRANQDASYFYLTRAVRDAVMFLKDAARMMSGSAMRGLAEGLRKVAEELYIDPHASDVASKLERAGDDLSSFTEFVTGNIAEATKRLDAAQAAGESGGVAGWRMLRSCQENHVSPLVDIIRPGSEFVIATDLLKNALIRIVETSSDDEMRSEASNLVWDIKQFFLSAPADIRSCNTRMSKAATRYMSQLSRDFAVVIAALSVGPAALEAAKASLTEAINDDLGILSVKVALSPVDSEIERAVDAYFGDGAATQSPRLILDRPEQNAVEVDVVSLSHLLDQLHLPIEDAFDYLTGLEMVGDFERAISIAYGALIEAAQYRALGFDIVVDVAAQEKIRELPHKTMTYTPVRIDYV
jgi:hypothetical protein